MTVASLGFAIDSSPAATAASDLDKLTSSAARAEQAAGKTGAAGSRMAQSFNGLSPTLDKIVSSLGRLETITTSIDLRLAAMATAANKAATATGTLDKAAIEASSSYRALEASMTAVQAAQGKADASLAKSLGMIDKQRDAIAKLNAELAKLRNNPGPTPNVPQVPKPANQNGGQGSVGNVTSQLFDVFATAPFMSPATVGFQQGPQMAQAFAGKTGKEAITGLVGGLAAIASPVSLAAIGLTTAAAAAVQFGAGAISATTETKKLDDLLDDHASILKRVASAYGGVAAEAAKAGNENERFLGAIGRKNQAAISVDAKAEARDFFTSKDVGRAQMAGRYGQTQIGVTAAQPEFQAAISKLSRDAKAGKADFDEFYATIGQKVDADPSLAKAADKVIAASEKFKQATDALKEYQRVQAALFNDRGPTGTLLSQGTTNTADMGNYAAFQKQQEIAAARNAQSLEAQIASIKARSADEKANAAGATAAAVYNNDETPAATRQRVAAAITLSQVQSEKELADAQRDRSLSLEKLLDDQKLESSLIGQTANATDDLRQKYSLTAALRAEAARKGISDEQEFQKVYGGEIEAIDKVIDKQRELITQRDMMMSRTNAAVAQTKYDAGNAGSLADLRRAQGAALGAIGAKTPQQLADAASARVLAEPVDPGKESQDVREYRASAAAALAYAQAEEQLKEAQRSRSLNLEKMLDDQRNEADLIGKTGGAAAALRKEYELTSAAKLEAAQRGAEVDSAELANIKAKAAELGKLTDAYNQQKFTFDLNQQNSDARLSPRDQQITTQLRQAGLPEDLNGANAKAAGQSIDWAANKAAAKGFLSDFEQNLVSNGGKIGKSFGDSLKNALLASTAKMWDGIFDKLGNVVADWLTGKSGSGASGSGAGLGAIGAIGGKLLGANDNSKSAASTGIISAYAKAIQSVESGGNYGALGPVMKSGDRAYGAYQVMGSNIPSWTKAATGTSLDPQSFLSSKDAQDKVFNKYFGDSVAKYGNPQDAASVWFSGRPMAAAGSASDGFNTVPQYVTKFNDALGDATKNVGTFGNGLGQVGQSLSSSFFPAAPAAGGASGGGIGGWFSSLFGGAFKPIGAQATLAASGGITGLFAGGTNYAPGGMAIVGEQGPELVDLNAGARVINNNSMRNMIGSGGGNSHVTVGVAVDNNGNLSAHVKSIVHAEAPGIAQSAARQTVGDYDKHQVRGGFGDNNRQYASRKG